MRSKSSERNPSDSQRFGRRLRVKQELLVAFGACDGGWNYLYDFPAELSGGVCDLFDGEFVDFGVADDAAFADVAAAGFELRFDEDDSFSKRGRSGEDRGEQERRGDKGDVHHEQGEGGLAGLGKCAGSEKAGIGAFNEANTRVVAEFHGDLSEAGVDGGYMGCAALQQAVGEAAGGGADVETCAVGYINFPVIKSRLELEAAAADIGHVIAEEADGGIGCDGSARLVDLLLVDEHAAGEDEGAGSFAALNEASV